MDENEIVRIGDGTLAVAISPKGAEVRSIVCDGLERLWCGDPRVWGRQAPLLFPLIGRLRDGSYELEGKTVEAPRHGFCRDRLFEVVQADAARATMRTREDEETLACYPFPFALEVSCEVSGRSLVKTIKVENTGKTPLPFEAGGHEAYSASLAPGETTADCSVVFSGLEVMSMFGMDEDGILTLPKTVVPLAQGRLEKTPEQLGIDTIVLEDVPGRTVTLECGRSGHGVTVEFPDFPYLGIWTKPTGSDALFLCIEPWSALPDAHFAPRELSAKPGVRTVAPGETAVLSYRATFF